MSSPLSRRRLLVLGGSLAGGSVLAACTRGEGSSSAGSNGGPLKFWDMLWGTGTAYRNEAQRLVGTYQGDAKVTYQSLPWANFVQTFSSAIASNTGPAVSSGGGFQALQFFTQDAIAPADNLVKKLKTQDFIPETIEFLKYQGTYFAVPWFIDARVLFYRKALLEKAGAAVPTDWPSLRTACVALRRIGVSGFGMAASPTVTTGSQQILSLMFNNGGHLFTADGKPDVVTDRNIETVEFLKELVSIGAIDKRYVSYTNDNLQGDIASGKVGMLFAPPSWQAQFPDAVRSDMLVASPLTAPHGDKGTWYAINNLMMYKNTPDQEESEEFLGWYLDNIKTYWQNGVLPAVPVRQSIVDLAEYQGNANNLKISKEWVPVGKTYAADSKEPFPQLNAVDGGQALSRFAQQVVQGTGNARALLTTLQQGLEEVVK
ncbi:ABC transporter substrate-binding protein [Cryptosporangium aurantiacum]|uniref:Carbohydrate ABC transporter substrate-binding protein, CUT1 family n=1 Tax=Cryptosporangium aurantiacum TaxID=134849 RepID=A0A1M7R3U1_9ACTN|nr:extracellular solute-binding protein [Cryptosporangium aurantiacum]SHN39522.1 carbohydrate ABC transporter substrate-binding protein, CUT1 family [Cryptosporangium aurantiacum]